MLFTNSLSIFKCHCTYPFPSCHLVVDMLSASHSWWLFDTEATIIVWMHDENKYINNCCCFFAWKCCQRYIFGDCVGQLLLWQCPYWNIHRLHCKTGKKTGVKYIMSCFKRISRQNSWLGAHKDLWQERHSDVMGGIPVHCDCMPNGLTEGCHSVCLCCPVPRRVHVTENCYWNGWR